MKNENIIGIIGTILVVGLVSYYSIDYFDNRVSTINTNGSNSADNMLTESSIASHSSIEDCWLIISNKVYDVTNYLSQHPGGRAVVLPYCGKEATVAFTTQDCEGTHSQSALEQLGALYLGNLNQRMETTGVVINTNSNSNTNSITAPVDSSSITFSTALVAEHATTSDCWLIINSGVYDVSNYLTSHPGGQSIVLPYCGKEATQAFNTQDGQGNHSSFASNELSNYRIGTIGSETTTEQIQQSQEQIPDTTINTNTTQPAVTVPNNITITTALVATHNTSGDCWIIVSNNVYAVSGYLNSHPGGRSIIIPYCGKDATRAFDTQGGQGSHSSSASRQLSAYLVGVLGSNTTDKNIEQIQLNVNQTPSDINSEEDEKDEDENEEEDEEDD